MSATNPFFKYNGQANNEIFTGVSASHTGNTTQTILCSVNIPANRYRAGDLIMIDSMLVKTGSGILTTPQYKFYWVAGLTASLTGAIQISQRSINNGNVFVTYNKRMYIRTADGTGFGHTSGTELSLTTANTFNDFDPGGVNSQVSNIGINWTIDGTIFATIVQPAAETTTQYYIKIWEFAYPVVTRLD